MATQGPKPQTKMSLAIGTTEGPNTQEAQTKMQTQVSGSNLGARSRAAYSGEFEIADIESWHPST